MPSREEVQVQASCVCCDVHALCQELGTAWCSLNHHLQRDEGKVYRGTRLQIKQVSSQDVSEGQSTGVQVPESVLSLVTNRKDLTTQEGIETEKETHQQNGTGPLLRLFI